MNRRTFCRSVFFGIPGGILISRARIAFAGSSVRSSGGSDRVLPLSQSFRYANFKAHEGESFTVFAKGIEGLHEVVDLQLVAVEKIKFDELTEQFCARLSGRADYLLPEGLYIFNSASDQFSLYLRPDVQNELAAFYTAEFNLMK